jgi:flavin-dependent dehydrogenase
MQRFGDRVIVETSAGALSVRALVGADGVGSAVRRALGLGRGSFMAQAVEVDTDAVESDPAADLLCFDVRDRRHAGYVWDFPTLVDGDPKMCRGVYRLTRGAPPSDAPDIAALLSDHLSGLGLHPDPKRYKRFAERGLSLWQATGGDRVLLVGEAAGIDPVLGEGIAQAILHGQTAGAYLARCWRAQHYGFEDYRRTLRASRVGLDLRVRAMLVNFVYDKTRPWCERWVTGSRALAHAGMQYFAGERVSRPALARAALDLPLSLIGAI